MGLVVEISTADEWHVMKGEAQFGPFTYAEMLGLLQNKTLFTFDFVWAAHLESWTMLGELPEFSEDRVHRIAEKSKDSQIFSERKHSRCECDFSIYVHDNQKLWTGTVTNVSVGGVLMQIDNPFFLPGDHLTVHFRETSQVVKGFAQGFNSRMEVLNKRLTKQKISYDTRLHYVLQFTQLPKTGLNQIEEFVKQVQSKTT